MPSFLTTGTALTGLLAAVIGTPVGDKPSPVQAGVKRNPLGISLPGGVVPAIPGVTEPLNSLLPPLPILQPPTPPLDSPPFTASNVKPKKIGYFWTGAGDNQHKDFLVTASLDDVSLVTLSTSQLLLLT